MKIIDISPALNQAMAVWPGDDPFLYQKTASGELTTGKMTTSIHAGAHIDAPVHINRKGATLDALPLDLFIGTCQVIDVSQTAGKAIKANDLIVDINAPRLLFKTNSFDYRKSFTTDFRGLNPKLIDYLAQKDIILVGIDTPSVDPYHATTLPAHHRLLHHGIAILEGLQLFQAPSGIYTLVALPLKIGSSDGSPTRAVLIQDF
jgi:arylformamidase